MSDSDLHFVDMETIYKLFQTLYVGIKYVSLGSSCYHSFADVVILPKTTLYYVYNMCYYNVHILFAAVAICNKVTRNSLLRQ